ncbi:circadian clock KaiB family protein [Mucilaginibacter sp. SG564]|uniref:circadian clock KaiB family protein n=1 Tax=unclassified Mucilaginibacter TaxID=2617802 RepID=UPI0015555F8E|nr:circadian clock KaiB family protein [Mucilaginibacter sp. SG564]NOW93944.1 circadian clock protein KaiB [Mucilaginibacter sp. SG564]
MTEKDQSSLSEDNYFNEQKQEVYHLRLFVTGASPNSARAITNLKDICETHLKGNYDLEIVDVYQQPLTVEHEQIIALPMLIKKAPGIERRLIGDMSNTGKVLKGLGLQTEN